MGRDTGPKCKKCRREGEKLFLKGERCYTQSCPLSRRSSPPGEREKQKVRRIYGLRERQFRNYVMQAKQQKGVTGDALLMLLERRFDNVLYRAGFAASRDQARQFITHGHFQLNGRPSNIPSILLNEGDTVEVKEGRRARLKAILETNKGRELPRWLEKNLDAMKFQAIALPNLEETGYSIAANLIVEYYSR
jgi:small subunit ribosomal protein S4